jgi:hypothetical protein
MMRKICALVSCLVLTNISVSSQSRDTVNLPIPHVTQKQDRLCWAACMEMLFQYRNDLTKNQCVIAEKMHRWIKRDPRIICTPCSTLCSKKKIPNKDICNKGVSANDIIGLLRDSFGINATVSTADWATLKTETLTKSSPIFGLSKTISLGLECSPNHVVAIRGYEIDKRTSSSIKDTFYLINDPVDKCGSSYKKVPFSQLSTINKICSFIIQLRMTQQPLLMSTSTTKPMVVRTDEDWTGEITEPLTDSDLKKRIEVGGYLLLEKHYTSTKNLKSETTIELLQPKNKPPFVVTTLQKIGNYWIPIEIKHTDEYADFLTYVDTKPLFFSNYSQKCSTELPILPYSKIVFLPDNDEYYVFRRAKGKGIVLLATDESDDKKILSSVEISKMYNVSYDLLNRKLVQVLSKKSFQIKLS